eukprot:Blabericola_migrator_1__2821@NODE_1807_length_3762_cov_37_917185_g1163_i0_p2_GENE_NODE_1807_length_3762_cov_37_917185_g1163_i0NODE_1807_length_3762_cov_37_917185_g1163_i0_p2_ORF_typecomplete_len391_score23_88RVT_1/PF00078_27/1_2e17RT_RNaseH/PF17917_1/3_9e16RT_RNaseH_2/PF17919_1/1_3e15RVT_thumb/PF06817_14/0_01_NODE_1807_length_3762_cov_37_917185_g1163_i07431915
MWKAGIIRPSTSPFAANPVLVRKKTGDVRFCVDYRALNRVTVRDRWPSPLISHLLASIKDSRYFIALDLRAACWEIPLRPSDIQKTAFHTHLGLFEFVVMPYGLCNAPATIQRAMDTLLGDLGRHVLAYLDDILIHSTSEDELLQLLGIVLDRLARAGFRLNFEKCALAPPRLEYLGHVITEGQLLPPRKRIDVLKNLPSPTKVSELRRAIGMLNYYRHFLPDLADHLAPAYALLRRNAKFVWSERCEREFRLLIDALAKATLTLPLDTDDFIITTGLRERTIAAALTVERDGVGYPVAYFSRTLDEAQRKWPPGEREAYAIFIALTQAFHVWVGNRHSTVFTEYPSLTFWLEARNGKLARWATLVAEFKVTILHKSGTLLANFNTPTKH